MFIIAIFQETSNKVANINKAKTFTSHISPNAVTPQNTWGPVAYIIMICALVVIGYPYEVAMATMLECVLCELSSVSSVFLKLILSLAVRMFYRCVGDLFAEGHAFPSITKWVCTGSGKKLLKTLRGPGSKCTRTYLRMRHGANSIRAICMYFYGAVLI